MYKIIKQDGGEELGIVEELRYIKVGRAGTYVKTTEAEAQGISFEGKAYNLFGHSEIKGDTVLIVNVPYAQIQREQAAKIDYLAMMTGIDLDVTMTKATTSTLRAKKEEN